MMGVKMQPEKVEDLIFRRMLNIENICLDEKISDKDFRYKVRVEIRSLLADISNVLKLLEKTSEAEIK